MQANHRIKRWLFEYYSRLSITAFIIALLCFIFGLLDWKTLAIIEGGIRPVQQPTPTSSHNGNSAVAASKSVEPDLWRSPLAWISNHVNPSLYHTSVKNYMRANANDPNSLEFIKWKDKQMDNGNCEVEVQYRAKNGFNALMLYYEDFVVNSDGKVIEAWPNSSIQF